MIHTDFINILKKVKELDAAAYDSLISNFHHAHCDKGKHLLRSQNTCDAIFFIESGILREYTLANDKEYNIWFSFEGSIVCDLQSFTHGHRSKKNIQCLSAVRYRYIKRQDLVKLASQYHVIETFYRKMVEVYFIEVEDRLLRMQTLNAKSHYDYLLKHYPHFIKAISLTHLASFLGITKESLSRIRRQK